MPEEFAGQEPMNLMKTMLIVDDVAVSRTVIDIMVSDLDVIVIDEAASGKEAVEKYKEYGPDIVVMDIVMNDMNGIEALKEIISHDPNATVVLISSLGEQSYHIKEAMEAGAKAILGKPIEKAKFVEVIAKLLEQ